MSETFVITRKVKIFPVGDQAEINRVYKYLRDGMESQNKAMNQYMSALYVSMMQETSKENKKELNNIYQRISTSKKGSAYDKDIQFAKGLPIGAFTKKVKSEFSTAMKKGLRYGRVSLPFYRATNPLYVHRDYVRLLETNPHQKNGIYHNYKDYDDFLKHLYKSDFKMFIKFANNITFEIIFGSPNKSQELRSVFDNIVRGVYEVQGSSIGIEKKKIILNLSLKVPKVQVKLSEDVVCGVDLGIAIPAMCALNTSDYKRVGIGSADDFIKTRTRIQSEYKRLQKGMANNSGGHGRKKKYAVLNRFKNYEKNWVQNYNHNVSNKVVKFALNNGAKYINLENLKGFGDENTKGNPKSSEEIEDNSKNNRKKSFILRQWSYYQLQQYITYKANKYGIEVRKVDPKYTSQICSCCGNLEKGQRVDQAHFVCKSCGAKLNADFNAARNIAMSTKFIEEDDENENS